MNDTTANGKTDTAQNRRGRRLRALIATVIAALVVAYTSLTLAGVIDPSHQLSTPTIVLLALAGGTIAAIAHPEVLQAISSLSALGIQVDLKQVQDNQIVLARRQEDQLQLLKENFPLLLPDNVRKHLENLEASDRGEKLILYDGGNPVREELRRLRYMHLIEVKPPHKGISEIPEGKFPLPDYVKLTPQGVHWIQRGKEIATMRTR